MKSLKEVIKKAEENKVAIGHFNVSDMVALRAIFESAKELSLPVIIGVSEGEREFIGTKNIALLVQNLREEFDYPIFLNADHTKSLEKVREAAEAGFDAILFDAGKLSLEDNIRKTKEAIEIIKSINPKILVEGELGYIGSSSSILEKVPEGAAMKEEDLTKPEQVREFVKETKVDLIAPAIGNIHGMFKNAPNPDINIQRIREIKEAADVSVVLHGGSGIKDEEFLAAIDAGVSIIHINTEIRLAWRRGLDLAIEEMPNEIIPYKLLPLAGIEVKKVVFQRLKLFNKIL